MAGNIELQDTLNRKEGPGKISAATPLEARLYGAGGEPIGTQAQPLNVQLTGQIQEFAVSDWGELDPDDVPIGSVAQLIGTDDIRQTDGQEWIRL